jgi:hypothetical protein
MKISLFLALFALTFLGKPEQKLLLLNEECVFSFKTKSGKTMMLAKDKTEKYLIYRFGTKNNIELEFPTKTKDSWKKFTYSYYFRGGGKPNHGRETENLRFTNNNVEYTIYWEYNAGDESEDESTNVGISISDLNTGKEAGVTGLLETTKGSLSWFKGNHLVKFDRDE